MSDQKGNDGEDDDKAAVRPSHPPQQDSVTFGQTQLLRLFLCGAVWNVLEPFHFLNLFSLRSHVGAHPDALVIINSERICSDAPALTNS